MFPRTLDKVKVPPIKCQGIKTKLVEFIITNIKWNGSGTWYEPFMGSGVITLNAAPRKAVLSDINPHLINFYNSIKSNSITPDKTRKFLTLHGKKLSETDDSSNSYYYEMRERFNENFDPLYFLFLLRSCYNGLIRFNKSGKFNTPFGRKPNRFSKAYITKIVNQVDWVYKILKIKDFTFLCSDWKPIVENLTKKDFIYVDPPYYGRHDTYYDEWSEENALDLVSWSQSTKSGYAISIWLQNRHRRNEFVDKYWGDNIIRTNTHYYFLGSTEDKRSKMEEALVIKPNYETKIEPNINEVFKDFTDK